MSATHDIRIKYPRTPHLPWSPSVTSDDKMLSGVGHFHGKHVIVTEKMDGENCTITNSYVHARSTDGVGHPSQSWVKGLQARIGYKLSKGIRLCGENVYAKHSIAYSNLPSYFLLFSVWENERCTSWNETAKLAEALRLHLVPVLYDGLWDETAIKKCWSGVSEFSDSSEGYVVRLADGFYHGDFDTSVAKYVRENHIQTDSHWKHSAIVPNQLKQLP